MELAEVNGDHNANLNQVLKFTTTLLASAIACFVDSYLQSKTAHIQQLQ
jgi:hypothetical protein